MCSSVYIYFLTYSSLQPHDIGTIIFPNYSNDEISLESLNNSRHPTRNGMDEMLLTTKPYYFHSLVSSQISC